MSPSLPAKNFEIVPSFASKEILDRCDGFLVDQWGVMHNGMESMKDAPHCIRELATTYNKKLVILSNSPSSEEITLQKLGPLGFDRNHFQGGAVTSGMLASTYIRQHYCNKNMKTLYMTWKHPAAPSSIDFLKDCGIVIDHTITTTTEDGEGENKNDSICTTNNTTTLELVQSIEQDPDVLIVQGNEIIFGQPPRPTTSNTDDQSTTTTSTTIGEELSLGDFVTTGDMTKIIDPLLEKCACRQIPLICVDPDFVTVNPDGSVLYMPGSIAKRYEEHFGGLSIYFGKPHATGFEEGIRRLVSCNDISDKSHIAMIGDSLHHDVTGANQVGLDSILVLGGVHRKDIGNHELGEMVPRVKLEELLAKEQQVPTIVTPLLKF